jgi:predicted nuclease of restriction endonuclease-like RecB superfamily
MLTGKMVRVRYARDHVIPQYLDPADGQWLQVAEQLLAVYRASTASSRGQVEEEIDELFGDLPQPLIHTGLAKLLEARCDFEVQANLPPEQVRDAIFLAAAQKRRASLEQHGQTFSRDDVVRQVAAELKSEPAQVEASLFADLKSEQRLTKFHDTTPERLLQRYNVALAQAVLLRSTGVEVVIRGESPQHYRQLFREIKFRRLICDVEQTKKNTYRLRLDGPLSLFSATQKYGLQLALFLPTLLLCSDFDLKAKVSWGPERKQKLFQLTAKDGLVSHQAETGTFVPAEVSMFVEMFQKKATDWEISAESDIIPVGSSFWVPDYRLVHRATGQSVMLDILGFWRRSSVERHLKLLREHADRPFLLAVSDQLHVEDADLEAMPENVVRFRSMPLADEIARRAHQVLFGSEPAAGRK